MKQRTTTKISRDALPKVRNPKLRYPSLERLPKSVVNLRAGVCGSDLSEARVAGTSLIGPPRSKTFERKKRTNREFGGVS